VLAESARRVIRDQAASGELGVAVSDELRRRFCQPARRYGAGSDVEVPADRATRNGEVAVKRLAAIADRGRSGHHQIKDPAIRVLLARDYLDALSRTHIRRAESCHGGIARLLEDI